MLAPLYKDIADPRGWDGRSKARYHYQQYL